MRRAPIVDTDSGIVNWSADGEGFDAFYVATNRALLGELYVLSGDLNEAQDCLQEAYVRTWQRWSTVSAYDRPDAWVRTVALRVARGRWRRVMTGLHHLCGFTVEEVAVRVGAPEGTVKARLTRGRAHLAQVLGEGTRP